MRERLRVGVRGGNYRERRKMGSRISLESEQRARRARWFARADAQAPAADQEAEVRERLYARPGPNDRTVHRVGPVQPMAQRPAA